MNIKKMVILGAPSDLPVLIDNFAQLMSFSNRLKKHLETEFSINVGLPISEFSTQKFGSAITTPTFIAHDDHDLIVAFSESQKTIKHWKNVTFVATENLGYSMHDHHLYNQIVDDLEL